MTKVLVTGNDFGLGKTIFEKLSKEGFEVEGVSFPSWDLASSKDRQWLVDRYKTFDVLVNNAYELDPNNLTDRVCGQNELLKLFLHQWKNDSSKYIISHSSKASTKLPQKHKYIKRYALDKKEHDSLITEWRKLNFVGPKVCNLRIGWYKNSQEQTYIKAYEPLYNSVKLLNPVSSEYYSDWVYMNLKNRDRVWLEEITVDTSDRQEAFNNYLKSFAL